IVQWDIDKRREKRAYESDPNVYLDAIGQPRGIPNKFKARSEVLSGYESIFFGYLLTKIQNGLITFIITDKDLLIIQMMH
ncbi:MAG: hypothetical protein ACRC0X_07540, partial [Brevinema sp.]